MPSPASRVNLGVVQHMDQHIEPARVRIVTSGALAAARLIQDPIRSHPIVEDVFLLFDEHAGEGEHLGATRRIARWFLQRPLPRELRLRLRRRHRRNPGPGTIGPPRWNDFHTAMLLAVKASDHLTLTELVRDFPRLIRENAGDLVRTGSDVQLDEAAIAADGPGQLDALIAAEGEASRQMQHALASAGLTKVERKLLRVLQRDPDLTTAEIAKRLGISREAAAMRRLRIKEKLGLYFSENDQLRRELMKR